MTLFDADRAPRCPRHELGTCPAPCAGQCTRKAYFQNVAAARQFLEGTNVRVLDRLHRRMRRAAAEQEFLRAANWRDIWQPLTWLHEELDGFREARRNYSFVYPVRNGGRNYWLLVHRGQAMRGLRAPHDAASAERCAARLKQIYFSVASPARSAASEARSDNSEAQLEPLVDPGAAGGRTDFYDAENVALMIAWFRRRSKELDATLSPTAGQAICRDFTNG